MEDKIKELRERREKTRAGGDPQIARRLREQGMLSARERIERLLDPSSFVELDLFVRHHCTYFGMEKREIPAEGVVTGHGQIDGRTAFVYAQDFTALAGTYGEMHGRKICKAMDYAVAAGAPIIGLSHSGGLRLHEVLGPMDLFGQLFYRNSIYSGVVPQISAVMGTVAGGQAYSPGLTDFIFMTKGSSMFIAGPAFCKTVIGEEVTEQELGGAAMHATVSGVCHVLAEDDGDCLMKIRELLSYLPSSYREKPPQASAQEAPSGGGQELNHLLPEDPRQPYDMHQVIERVVDGGRFFEVHALYAPSILIGFSRLDGQVVGIVASQPLVMGGSIDVKAAEKAARFVRFCDAFNIPLIFLQDTPAYLIGSEQERAGMIYRGSKLLYAVSEATVPKMTVLLRKAYAGAYIAMGSKYVGADRVFAWPSAEIASVGPETAASIIFRREIETAKNPEEVRQQRLKEYYERFINPYHAAELQHVDDIIEPRETRSRLISSLRVLASKKELRPERKHDNIPL